MEEGWIKISRDIVNHAIFNDAEYFRAWIDLIILAEFRDKDVLVKGEIKHLKRGAVYHSIDFFCDRWHWSRKKLGILSKI